MGPEISPSHQQAQIKLGKPAVLRTESSQPDLERVRLLERLIKPEKLSAIEVFSDVLALNSATFDILNITNLSYTLRDNYDLGVQALLRSKDFDPQNNKGHELFFNHLTTGLLEQQRFIQTHQIKKISTTSTQ
jgi:hypothetical protein